MLKKIVIFGGAGFIGTNVCLSAFERGYHIVVFDNFSRNGTDINLDVLKEKVGERLEVVRGDIRSAEDVQEVFKKHSDAEVYFHLAAQVAVTESVRNPREDFEINAVGTLNILEEMRAQNIHGLLLYASTNKVFGDLTNLKFVESDVRYELKDYPNGISESHPLDFHSPYGCSKGAADQYVIDYARVFGLKTMVFRQSCIYGYHQFGIEDQGWVAWFVIAGLFDRPITLFGNGKQVRDILFVDDLMEAYWAGVEHRQFHNGAVYNIGGGVFSVSLLELLHYLEELFARKINFRHADFRPGDQLFFTCDVSRAGKELGWVPRTSVKEGVKLLADWVSRNKEIFVRAGVI